MTVADDLFVLIKSLSGSEKRYFKLSASVQRGNKNYLKLFNSIEAQKEYDEEAIQQEYKGEKFIKHLPSEKNYLFNHIIKTLVHFQGRKTVEDQLQFQLKNANILLQRGLYRQCYKTLEKIKKTGLQYERYNEVIKALYLQRRIIFEEHVPEISKNRLSTLLDEINVLHEKQHILDRLLVIKHRLFDMLRKEGMFRTPQQVAKFKAIVDDPLLSDDSKATSINAKLYFYSIKAFYYLEMNNYKKAYTYQKKNIALIEKYTDRIEGKTKTYMNELSNFIIMQLTLEKFDEAMETIDKIAALPTTSTSSEADIFIRSYSFRQTAFISIGEFKKAKELIGDIESGLKKYKDTIDKKYAVRIYYKTSYMYFVLEEYDKALIWINKLVSQPESMVNPRAYLYARIFNLVLHYELGNEDLLEHLIRSTYRFLYKKGELYKFETAILKFIKNKIPKVITQKELIGFFKELLTELKAISKDPMEAQALRYFDFILWLKSKVEGKSFVEELKIKSLSQ